MFTVESVQRRIKKLGVPGFLTWLSNNNFSEEDIIILEKSHIMRHNYPCLSTIYYLFAC